MLDSGETGITYACAEFQETCYFNIAKLMVVLSLGGCWLKSSVEFKAGFD
jgi:hypothetical protein